MHMMKYNWSKKIWTIGIMFFGVIGCTSTPPESEESTNPLPSWNPGETKQAILDFVLDVTDAQSEYYVAVPDRIAVLIMTVTCGRRNLLTFNSFLP